MALSEAVAIYNTVSGVIDGATDGKLDEKEIKRLMASYKLALSGGNVFKFLGQYVVSPTIFISKDLEGTPSETDAINAQLNVFVASYIQAFQIMVGIDGVDPTEAVYMLSTSKGVLGETVTRTGIKIAESMVKYAKTECDLTRGVYDFLGETPTSNLAGMLQEREANRIKLENDMILADTIPVNECYSRLKVAMENRGMKFEDDIEEAIVEKAPNGMTKGQLEELIDYTYKQEDAGNVKKKIKSSQFGGQDPIGDKLNAIQNDTGDIKKLTEQGRKEVNILAGIIRSKNAEEKAALRAEIGGSVGVGERKHLKHVMDDPTFNYFIRNFELNVDLPSKSSQTGTSYKMTIPITVRAYILYVGPESIESQLQVTNKSDDNSIFAQWDDYRTGAKSFWDFMFANTLVRNYRRNLQKDTDDMLEKLEANNRNGQLKTITGLGKGDGFQKFYNLFILSERTIERLGNKIGNLRDSSAKDKFMDKINSQQLLVIDYEYETFKMYLLSIDGESKGRLVNLSKPISRDKNDDILSALLANTVPRI